MIKKRISAAALIIMILLFGSATAYAIPPSNPHIESGTYADGGYYFEYRSSVGWKDLRTPHHWVAETNEVAYCLEHKADSPAGDESYNAFDPSVAYSTKIYNGLLIILKNGYPYQTGGLSENKARYATANAIRAWLSENGIGYNFMTLSRGYVRPNSGYHDVFDYMVSLVEMARNTQQPAFSISANPSNIKLNVQGSKISGTTQIVFSNLNGNYTIDNSKVPSGVSISGYTGNDGDVLTISAPSSLAGQTISMNGVFIGHDTRANVNMYWFKPGGDEQSMVVPVVDTVRPVAFGSLKFSSDALGWIEIIKRDETTGERLAGAVFEIKDSSDNVVGTLTTDTDGHAKSNGLVAGTYSIREISAPFGYVIDINVHENISVSPNDLATVNLTNQPQKGTITIKKQDRETGNFAQGDATLTGAVFEVRNSKNTVVDTVTVGQDGKAITKELPLGAYTIMETIPPTGYNLNPNEYTVNITYSNQTAEVNMHELTVADEVIKGSISIVKFADAALAEWNTDNPNLPLQDVVFEVRLKSTGELVDTLTTDADGLASSVSLPYGTYTITETQTVQGFRRCKPFDVVIDENGKVYSYDIENEVYRSQVKIVKVDSHTGKVIAIAGTQFQIRDSNGELIVQMGNYPTPVEMDTFITDESGTITLPEPLIYGEYTLHEITPPYGYWLNEEQLDFSVDDSGESLVTVAFANELIQKRIRVIKVGENDEQRPLAGAVFELRKEGDLIETITTNEEGEAMTELLKVGDYTLTEIQAPIGFVFDDTTIEQNVSDDETLVYTHTITNRPTRVMIVKTDLYGNPLEGACIEIWNEDEHVVFEGMTDENGEVEILELPVGRYRFVELTAPAGYVLNENIYEFEVLKNGEIIGNTVFENKPTQFTISKTDITDGRPVSNAEIEIYSSDNQSMYKCETDENGEIIITHLPVGTYTFVETTAPEGYVLSDEVITFTIDEYGEITGETTMSNSPTTLEISKVVYEDGKPLTGAGFKVKGRLGLNTMSFIQNEDGTYRYDKDGTIQEIKVDEDGKAKVYGLPQGSYWLEESIVPEGYYPTAPIKFMIGETNNIEMPCEVVVPNSVFVKLGLDRDKYNIPIAIGFAASTLAGLVFFFVRRKKAGSEN